MIKTGVSRLYFNNKKNICIPITFHNPIEACFSNNKYAVLIQTYPKQIENSVFVIENSDLTGFL